MQCYPYLADLVLAVTGLDLPLPLPMFGLFVVIGGLVAMFPLRAELRRLWRAGALARPGGTAKVSDLESLDEFSTSFVVWMLLTGILGSRLFSILEDVPGLIADPASKVFTRNGFNIIGGLVVATAVGVWLFRRAGLRVRPAMDAAAPAVMLGYAVGRIGCQISGDGDWGLAADLADKPGWLPTWLWAQTYPGNILGETIPAPGVYPTPIWETVVCLVLFAVLFALRRHPFRRGWLFALYMVLASAERLWIEPLRVNERYGPWNATQAQYFSALFLVLGLVALAVLTRRRPPEEAPVAGDGSRSEDADAQM